MSLNEYIEDKVSALYEELGAFYAFSNEQLAEQKKEGVEYVRLVSGLICPKENADDFMKRFEEIVDAGMKERLEKEGRENVIKYELSNYECYYVGSWEEALPVLESYGITEHEVAKVYYEEYPKQEW